MLFICLPSMAEKNCPSEVARGRVTLISPGPFPFRHQETFLVYILASVGGCFELPFPSTLEIAGSTYTQPNLPFPFFPDTTYQLGEGGRKEGRPAESAPWTAAPGSSWWHQPRLGNTQLSFGVHAAEILRYPIVRSDFPPVFHKTESRQLLKF